MPIRGAKRAPELRRGAIAVCLAALLALGAFSVVPVRAAVTDSSITVSAAISLKDALDRIGTAYERAHPGARIAFNFAGSGTLQHQIEQGAPVDVFFSAAEKQMNTLDSEKLTVSGSRRNIVTNELVLIVPRPSNSVRNFQDLLKPNVKIIAVGEPSTVPAGMYAQQALQHMGLWAKLQKKFVFAKDVRQVLTYVETGNADAGLVYRTDAKISSNVRIVAAAPADSHAPIVYPAAIVKGTKQLSAARAFLDFLSTARARAIFARYGFTFPENHAKT
ncbi:MAG: molybdate ABC transporter substrate-binding protein [Candidatus Acidiferrales bacterium]